MKQKTKVARAQKLLTTMWPYLKLPHTIPPEEFVDTIVEIMYGEWPGRKIQRAAIGCVDALVEDAEREMGIDPYLEDVGCK
jgi:hypothetical protein